MSCGKGFKIPSNVHSTPSGIPLRFAVHPLRSGGARIRGASSPGRPADLLPVRLLLSAHVSQRGSTFKAQA
ncbi:hypothetical protein BKA93DRAFT_769996 [Sparassis latifolia]